MHFLAKLTVFWFNSFNTGIHFLLKSNCSKIIYIVTIYNIQITNF